MKYWVIADTHLGHDQLLEYAGRPTCFEDTILENVRKTVQSDGVLIHLGDVCIGNDAMWHEHLLSSSGKKWLIKGNHDSKSTSWYLAHGWDFVGDSLTLKMFGHEILFSHYPIVAGTYTLNIHGHFHNSDHRRHEPEFAAIKNDKQVLVMMEHHYMPQDLRKIVGSATGVRV
jgi:calcineurin-like phosphoesterase family protein